MVARFGEIHHHVALSTDARAHLYSPIIAETQQRETVMSSSTDHHQLTLLQQPPAWMWNHHLGSSTFWSSRALDAPGSCRLQAASDDDRNPDYLDMEWKKQLEFSADVQQVTAAAPRPPAAQPVLQLYGNDPPDDGVCNLTSLVKSCSKAAVVAADQNWCGDHDLRIAAASRSFVPRCAESIHGSSALGVTFSSITAAASATAVPTPKSSSLFEFGITTTGSTCSTPSFCVAGSRPVTVVVPAMPPPRHDDREVEAVSTDHDHRLDLVSLFDGGQLHDASCLDSGPAPGVVQESDQSNRSECLSFDDSSSLSEHVDGPAAAYVVHSVDPGNMWSTMQQAHAAHGRNVSFLDSGNFWIMPQAAATMMSDYDHESMQHSPIPTSTSSNSHFSELLVPFRGMQHPAASQENLPSAELGKEQLRLANSMPKLHTAFVGNGDSSHTQAASHTPRWCSTQQVAWIDRTMQQQQCSAREGMDYKARAALSSSADLEHAGLAPPPDQGHALLQYAKSRGHDIAAGVEILVGAPGSTVSSTRSRKRPNDEELVEQITSGESCTLVDEPAGGTRLTAARFMATSPMNPQLSKLVGAGLEMFESGAGSSCVNGFGRKFFDDQSTAVTTAALLYGAQMASLQQGGQLQYTNNSCNSQTTTTSDSASDPHLSPLVIRGNKIRRTSTTRHGTASDPQSIAARTRREKFSDRIRILQTLVPNGERLDTVSTLGQTLEYVRFLQHQVWEFYNGGGSNPAAVDAYDDDHERPEAAAAAADQSSKNIMPEKWKQFKEHIIAAQIVA